MPSLHCARCVTLGQRTGDNLYPLAASRCVTRLTPLTHPTILADAKRARRVRWAAGRNAPQPKRARSFMPNYLRPKIGGATWFFTVNLGDRRGRLLTQNIDALRSAMRKVQANWPFVINAIVVLPDHLHCVLTLPDGDTDFSKRWRLIKSDFSRVIPRTELRSSSRVRRRERGVWQRRFWEHAIRDDEDFQRHVEYCYFNPVKHGYVSRVVDWPHSSFHRDVELGLFPEDWAGDWDDSIEYGEPT